MDTIKCLAIDDEYLALKIITDYVNKIPFLELVATSKSALGALDILENEKIDLLLLDIQMPEISGLDFLASLKNPPLVILTTAYPQFALQAYDYSAIDYLLKPIRFERFLIAINKAKEQFLLRKGLPSSTTEQASDENSATKDYCFLKTGYKSERVFYSDFLYIEGQKEYISIYTKNKKYTLLKSLIKMQDELPDSAFIRIHKSFIIALDKVESFYGNTVQIGDVKLPIGRSYKETVKKALKS